MQTEASVLPVVQLDEHRPFNRKSKLNSKSSILESKNQSLCRNTLLPPNKKSLNPLLGTPYRGSIKQQSLSDESKCNKSVLGQRVMSAKMLRFKQLQNQLADAHYHLNELANENRLLKALQKRQDSALRRYEGTNAELPRLINSHHEELRVLQTKYKKLKDLHKDTCNLLKEKENELYSVNSQNKHLLQLSKDRHLEEREKLQLQLSDMNHKMQQQHETIQLLRRKLALETKSLKHQLHVEISKHKETQKNLQETIEKLKNLECLLDNREKRLYYNGQMPIYTKQKNLGSHSLTNLSIASPAKVSSRNKRSENDIPRDNLPSLDTLESNNDGKVIQATNDVNHDRSMNQLKSETMASLQQIRKFRLQRSSNMCKNAYSMDDIRFRPKDTETTTHNNDEELTLDSKVMLERDDLNDKNESGKLRKLFSRIKSQNLQKVEFDYSSDDGKSDISEHHIESYPNTAHKSRELYAKLISSDGTSDTLNKMMKRTDIHYNNEEEEEELNIDAMKDLAFQKHLQESKLKVLQHYRNKDIYDSDSEVDSEEKIDINGDTSTEYKMNEFQINSSKYAKKQFSKSFNDTNQQEYSASEIREQISKEITGRLQNVELQRISDDTLDNIHVENAEVIKQSSKAKKIWLEDRQLSKNNEIDHFSTNIKKEDHSKEEEAKYSEDKTVYSDSSYDNHETLKQNDEIKSLPSPERKDIEKSSQQTYKKESITNDSDGNNQSTHNLEKEYLKSRIEEMLSTMQHNDEEILNKDNFNVETKNKLNTSFEAEDISTLSNNAHVSHQNEQSNGTKTEITNTKQSNEKKKVINYNKEKLLATMRAIDDNENIEFLNQGFRNHNMNRMQITENLYRGLPTHSKPKRDIIKDIFEDNHIENKVRGTCSKSH